MQNVSVDFDPYIPDRWVDYRSLFRVVDVTAAGDTTATATGEASVSQKAQTHDGIEILGSKWAALERGGWPLDGGYSILPDVISGAQTGYWSVLSDISGAFSAPYPSITYPFSVNHSSLGFTLCFDNMRNQYPKTVKIDVYNSSNALIDTQTISCTSVYQVVDMPVTNYRKVTVSFLETQAPYQSVRLPEIIFGIVQRFDKTNLTGARLTMGISPVAEYLPSTEQEITFDNSDKRYNMPNPSGLYFYLQDGQIIETEIGIGASKDGIEYVNAGKTYYTKSIAEDDSMTAKIISNDPFLSLDGSICRIGTTGTWTLDEAVAAIITSSGQSITTDIPAAIGARILNKCIPSNASHREAFRLSAQAARCTCWFSRDDVLMFREVAAGVSVDTLNNTNLSNPANSKGDKKINTVELTVKNEYAATQNVYTAQSLGAGEAPKVWSVNNPLANDGAAVASWLLAYKLNRSGYILNERGNPAPELADTVTVYDDYDNINDAVITDIVFIYDGGLSVSGKAKMM